MSRIRSSDDLAESDGLPSTRTLRSRLALPFRRLGTRRQKQSAAGRVRESSALVQPTEASAASAGSVTGKASISTSALSEDCDTSAQPDAASSIVRKPAVDLESLWDIAYTALRGESQQSKLRVENYEALLTEKLSESSSSHRKILFPSFRTACQIDVRVPRLVMERPWPERTY